MRQAVFLDRDGVINRKAPGDDYIIRWEDFEFLPGVQQAIAQLNQAGVDVIVITNQRCVAKGLITITDLERLHRRMLESLAERGARIDSIYYCPHELDAVCRCRKPAPGLFIDAARDHGIDLKRSWMIGDSESDVAAGKNAGCKTALIVDHASDHAGAEFVVDSLLEAVEQILNYEKQHSDVQATMAAALRPSSIAGV